MCKYRNNIWSIEYSEWRCLKIKERKYTLITLEPKKNMQKKKIVFIILFIYLKHFSEDLFNTKRFECNLWHLQSLFFFNNEYFYKWICILIQYLFSATLAKFRVTFHLWHSFSSRHFFLNNSAGKITFPFIYFNKIYAVKKIVFQFCNAA